MLCAKSIVTLLVAAAVSVGAVIHTGFDPRAQVETAVSTTAEMTQKVTADVEDKLANIRSQAEVQTTANVETHAPCQPDTGAALEAKGQIQTDIHVEANGEADVQTGPDTAVEIEVDVVTDTAVEARAQVKQPLDTLLDNTTNLGVQAGLSLGANAEAEVGSGQKCTLTGLTGC
jgi:hypothetical protein